MNQLLILQGITVEDLMQKIEALIEKKFADINKPMLKDKVRYMMRKEVREHLHISMPTLNEWTKQGLIISHRIGNRVLYKSDE